MTEPDPQAETLMVTVWTKPSCVQCEATKRWLTRKGIPFVTADLTPEKAEEFQAQGILTAPVVVLPTGATFGGYQVTRLEAYAASLSA